MGSSRNDIFFGQLTSLLANINKTKHAPAFKPSDFMPYSEREEGTSERLTDDEICKLLNIPAPT